MAIHLGASLYRLFIDPLLAGLRRDFAAVIPEGSRVLEIGSGTGAQALVLADRGCSVLGIEMDSRMTAFAAGRIPGPYSDRLEFKAADGRSLDSLPDRSFDCSAATLMLHAINSTDRKMVLREMARLSPTVYIADYASPMPQDFGGFFASAIESLAGGEHLAGFLDYQASGGIEGLISGTGLSIIRDADALGGVVRIVELADQG